MIDNTKRRQRLPYEYRTYTSVIPTNTQIDRYNSIQDEINCWIDAGKPIPEWLLNWSAEYFKLMAREFEWLPKKEEIT